jgi:heptosyltransferase-2
VSDTWVVRLPTWLGDNIMALAAVRGLARASDRPLVLWGPPAFAELFALTELQFDYLPYRRRHGLGGLSDALRAAAGLRRRHLDAALLLPNAFESALLARAAGIARRIGYATDGRGRLLTDALPEPLPRHAVHETERFARLAQYAGAGTPLAEDAALAPSDELRRRSTELLPSGVDHVGLVAGSANAPARRWPAAAFADLATEIHRQWSAQPVLLGSDADRTTNEQVARGAAVDTVDLSGCSLTDLMAALLRCRVVISNDTGAAHLAAALGRPTVVLFGPTDPARTGARGAHVMGMSANSFCQPCCYLECPLNHLCMSELSPAAVLEAALPFWQRDL